MVGVYAVLIGGIAVSIVTMVAELLCKHFKIKRQIKSDAKGTPNPGTHIVSETLESVPPAVKDGCYDPWQD